MDKMIITQTFTMARWQIVVKKSEATKQTKDQTNNKTKTKTETKQNAAVCVFNEEITPLFRACCLHCTLEKEVSRKVGS